jgi:uncharacterized protein (DUF1499 family)
MPRTKHSFLFLLLLFCCFVSVSCATGETAAIGDAGAGVAPCPASPNCVSSEAQDADHHVAPLRFTVPPEDAWRLLKEQLAKQPRTVIVTEKPGYLHAQSKSAVFGFVDDLEFYLRPARGVIAVRFAARTGYYDFGVNRQRVEELRAAFRHAGAAQ